jgi:hypothetical protein
MNITSTQLQEPIDELRRFNEELADAARPLKRLPDLNEEHRDQIGKRLRAGLARWNDVTSRIQRLLGSPADDWEGEEDK